MLILGAGLGFSPEALRRAWLTASTQPSISVCDDASTRKVRFVVTMPKVNECFLILTGAHVWMDFRSRTRESEYSCVRTSAESFDLRAVGFARCTNLVVFIVGQSSCPKDEPLLLPDLLLSGTMQDGKISIAYLPPLLLLVQVPALQHPLALHALHFFALSSS